MAANLWFDWNLPLSLTRKDPRLQRLLQLHVPVLFTKSAEFNPSLVFASGFAPDCDSSSTNAASPKSIEAAYSSGVIPCQRRDVVVIRVIDRSATVEQRPNHGHVPETNRLQQRRIREQADHYHLGVDVVSRHAAV
jgi:hypothetical protein